MSGLSVVADDVHAQVTGNTQLPYRIAAGHELKGVTHMHSEQLLTEARTPSSQLIKLGERYTNIFGVELEVKRISRPAHDDEVLVEFMPLDAALNKWWWGMFLPECRLLLPRQVD